MTMVHGQSEDQAASGYQSAVKPTLSSLEGTSEWGTFMITIETQKKFPNSIFMKRAYDYDNMNTNYFRYHYLSF